MCKYIKATDAADLIHRLMDMPYSDLVDPLAAVPAANVAPVVRGEWKTSSDRPDTLICSACNYGFDMWKHDPHNYCPNCGAKMDGEVEEQPHE